MCVCYFLHKKMVMWTIVNPVDYVYNYMHVTNRTVDRVEICSCYILVMEYKKK